MAAPNIVLKALIDTQKKRVLFAECNYDFIDILCSFFTLSMETIIQLIGEKSTVGSMKNIYESAKELNELKFRNNISNSTSEEQAKDSTSKINGTKEPTKFYICQTWDCSIRAHRMLSNVKDTPCHCGRVMNQELWLENSNIVSVGGDGGLFVKGKSSFIVTDDLRVMPRSIITSLSLLRELGLDHTSCLEEKTMKIEVDEVLLLLRCSLLSDTPLTDVILLKECRERAVKSDPLKVSPLREEKKRFIVYSKPNMEIELVISKSAKSIFLAEVGENLTKLLFSFLNTTLGTAVELFGGRSSMVCVDNLYKSLEDLSNQNYMKSLRCNELIVWPEFMPNRSHRIVQLQIADLLCYHTSSFHKISEENASKTSSSSRRRSGEGQAKFMVTDSLVVRPVSSFPFLMTLKEFNERISHFEERVVTVGEREALNLLKAALISQSCLDDVFLAPYMLQ